MSTAVVFLGPTLALEEARDVADAIYLPPAAQGSVIAAVQRYSPDVILVIDGVFHSEPALRHKELLWAMAHGIVILGAASMGALRAAELYPAMQGVGLIYRWYRRFSCLPDDAVAVIHAPVELGSSALTLAHIDLRLTARAAVRQGKLGAAEANAIVDTSSRLNFRERTLERIIGAANITTADRPAGWWSAQLTASLVEQKKRDALEALRMLGKGNFRRRPPGEFITTAAFLRDVEAAGLHLPSQLDPGK
jgi:hypothetical protein